MSLLDFFKRKPAPAGAALQGDAAVVQRARQQARRRLIGAAVLLGVGVIGFPLLFETQPRPIPVDIPIEIPAKEGAAPLRLPAARARATGPVVSEPVPASAHAAVAAAEVKPAASVSAVATAAAALSPVPTVPTVPTAPKAAPQPEPKAPATAAQLPGAVVPAASSASAATAQRFVVQVGAFADATAARAVRMRVEKLGLKTFTQVVETPAGKRIRVRVGPYNAKSEADKAAQVIHKGDLPAAVLIL